MNTEALLADLATALADPDGIADPTGMLEAWARTVRGEITADTTFRLTEPREGVALAIITEQGAVSSGALAQVCGVHPETARLTLAGMAARGCSRPRGNAGGDGIGSRAGDGTERPDGIGGYLAVPRGDAGYPSLRYVP
jgi:hypothetical protein